MKSLIERIAEKFNIPVNQVGDSGYIGEELLSGVSELESKCRVIKMCIDDNTFTLSEALEAYEVSSEDYENYLLNK
jgi:hypothetical protein